MTEFLLKFVKKSSLIAASAILAVSLVAASVATVAQPGLAAAADYCSKTVDKSTNVIYCGLDDSNYISSFQNYYDAGSDAHAGNPTTHTDLKTVYNYGASKMGVSNMQALVDSMNSSNTYLGYSYNDGTVHITFNGQDTVVGTNMQIAARWVAKDTQNFTRIGTTNVYMHSYTRWFSSGPGTGSKVPTIVHINPTTGLVDFATWTPCGNMLIVTPKPLPKSLQCVSLSKDADTVLKYSFTAKASATNTTIKRYDFNFGDGNFQTVSVNGATTTTVNHTYTQTSVQQTVTAKVTVSDNNTTVTSGNCQVQIVIPPKEQQKSLVCTNLTATPQNATKTSFVFTATATAQNTTIDSFIFDFGDGSAQQTIATTGTSASSTAHTFAAGNFTIKAWVHGPLGQFGGTGACVVPINVETPPLVNTGPGGIIGLFAATSTLGGLFHQFVLRKRLTA